jgi:DNA-binding NarL/FixJ family response regulator
VPSALSQGQARGALPALVSLDEDLEVVADADCGDVVLPAATENKADTALLDVDLPVSTASRSQGSSTLSYASVGLSSSPG